MVYLANRSDFAHTFGTLLHHLLPATMALTAMLILVSVVVGRRWAPAYQALLLAIGLLLWIQSTFLLPEMGLLDGTDPDWVAHAWRTPRALVLWIGGLAIAWLLRRRLSTIAPFMAGALLVTQAVPVVLSAMQGKLTVPASTASLATQPPPGLFQLSREPGAIVLVLDGFQSDVMRDIVEAPQNEDLRRALDGFVFFTDHAGAFPTTKPSIPAMLSGLRYQNAQPRSVYFANAYGPRSVFKRLADTGFEIDLVTLLTPALTGPLRHAFHLSRPYTTPTEAEKFAAAQLADLSLFRHAPHPLKPWIFNQQAWRLQARSPVSRRRFQATTGQAFLTELTSRMTVGARAPTVSFIHVGIPHLPAVLDDRCRDIPPQSASREAFTAQATCATRLLAAFLDRLRALEIYDQTAIIVAADHGVMFRPRGLIGDPMYLANMPWLISRAMPLFMVKRPGSQEPLTLSSAPTTMTDLPATLMDLLDVDAEGFPGESVLDIEPGAQRVRHFSAYHWRKDDWEGEFFEALYQLEIDGPLLDARSWHYRETVFAPGLDLTAERIDLGSARAQRHLGLGWVGGPRVDGKTTQWAVGPEASLHLALPPGEIVLEATLHAPVFHSPQTIDVLVDDRPVARWQPSAGDSVTMTGTIPADLNRPAVSNLVLRFERYGKRGDDPRPLAVLFDEIRLHAQ